MPTLCPPTRNMDDDWNEMPTNTLNICRKFALRQHECRLIFQNLFLIHARIIIAIIHLKKIIFVKSWWLTNIACVLIIDMICIWKLKLCNCMHKDDLHTSVTNQPIYALRASIRNRDGNQNKMPNKILMTHLVAICVIWVEEI